LDGIPVLSGSKAPRLVHSAVLSSTVRFTHPTVLGNQNFISISLLKPSFKKHVEHLMELALKKRS
jgi:hypothetical protein